MLSPRPSDKDALIFSRLAEMKFKPLECPLLRVSASENEALKPSEFQRLESTISTLFTPDQINKQVKFLFSVNHSYFLIGN